MSASEMADGRKRTAGDIDADTQRPNKVARGDAADDEDDLSFLLELRRKSGEVIQLPKRKSRKERLAALLEKKRPDALEDDEPEDKEVSNDMASVSSARRVAMGRPINQSLPALGTTIQQCTSLRIMN